MLFFLMEEERKYMGELALAQLQLEKEKGVERFEEYRKMVFPWIKVAQDREKEVYRKALERAVRQGPLRVSRQFPPMVRSRNVERVGPGGRKLGGGR